MQLRQQRLEFGHDASRLHAALSAREATLWTQQVQIATRTTPAAVRRAVGAAALHLEPAKPVGSLPGTWATAAVKR